MKKKIDGVIEAVRYKNGQITAVRVYERRGATFSDWLLLDRKTLLERLEKGQKFVIGSRKDLLASTFDVKRPVLLVKSNGNEFIATREHTDSDNLENTPFF
jgi:predicted AAA+ superfamily ATPase